MMSVTDISRHAQYQDYYWVEKYGVKFEVKVCCVVQQQIFIFSESVGS